MVADVRGSLSAAGRDHGGPPSYVSLKFVSAAAHTRPPQHIRLSRRWQRRRRPPAGRTLLVAAVPSATYRAEINGLVLYLLG